MELLDVLNENGEPTGKALPISEIYDNGYWHRSVHVWIINSNNELLMQRRNPNKKTFPNMWAISVAGHVRMRETSIGAAKRELAEEIDYIASDEELEHLFTIRREQPYKEGTIRVIDDVFLLKLDVDVDHTLLQVEELTDLKYIYFEYLEKLLLQKDETYVPYCEEHKLLFEELRKRFK